MKYSRIKVGSSPSQEYNHFAMITLNRRYIFIFQKGILSVSICLFWTTNLELVFNINNLYNYLEIILPVGRIPELVIKWSLGVTLDTWGYHRNNLPCIQLVHNKCMCGGEVAYEDS